MSVYQAMWASSVSRTITIVWKTSVNTEQSAWTLSMDIPASAKRASGEPHTAAGGVNAHSDPQDTDGFL